MPTQAPTGSTSLSRETTAIFARPPGLARRGLDPHDALVHLRHLLLEELDQELEAGPREHDLRALRGLVDVDHVGPDAVVRPVVLAGHLLLQGQHGLGAAEVDDDRALLEAADDAVDDLALPVLVLVVDVLALRLANALDDHLLRGLGENAPEARRVELDADLVADLGVGVELVGRVEGDLGGVGGHLVDHLAELEELDLAEFVVERASISLSCPCSRRAACFIASSRAPMISFGSMPLSLAI